MNWITGKLILVTGASSGIGEACARRFAAEGANLALWARRRDRLQQLAVELGGQEGVAVELALVDVRDRAAVNRAAATLVARGEVPDVLINNAGLASGLSKIQDGDPEDWDRMIDTNLKGVLNVTRAILPHMIARRRGHIVNIGSTAGHMTYPMGNVYNATKFGVRALTEGMNLDVVGTPIRVSAVDPGFVETEFSEVRFHGDAACAKSVYQGYGRLRLADFAAAAPAIDAYRSQPDSTGLLATARPFTFRATSPYFESTPGNWTVVISHRAMRDTLLATGPIAVPDGQAWTVALVDSIGGSD